MKKVLYIMIILTLVNAMQTRSQTSFGFKMSNALGASFDKITFGIHPQATSGLDTALGERDYPFAPPGDLHSFVFITDSVTKARYNSYINYMPYPQFTSLVVTYKFRIYNNYGSNLVIKWGKLPATVDSAYLIDGISGDLVVVNLKKSDSVFITGPSANIESYQLNVWYNTATDVADNENTPSLKLYPIPCYDQLQVELKATDRSIAVHTLNGTEILKTNALNGSSININTGNYQQGVYFISVSDNNGSIRRRIFIKE